MNKIKPTDKVPDHAEWRPFPLNPVYLVSEFGHMTKINGRGLLRPYPMKNKPYFTYTPTLQTGGTRTFGCHVIVALTFIGRRPSKRHEVAHNDGDGSYCHFSNLRWATKKSNSADTIRLGRIATGLRNGQHTHPEKRPRGERAGRAVLTDNLVRYIRKTDKSIRALSRELGVSRFAIKCAKRRISWTHIQ
jgi:hypothetical protein